MKFQGRMSFCILQFNLNFHGISCIPTSLSLFLSIEPHFWHSDKNPQLILNPPLEFKRPHMVEICKWWWDILYHKGDFFGEEPMKEVWKNWWNLQNKAYFAYLEVILRLIVWRFLITLLGGLETNFSFILMGFCNLIPKIDKWIQSFCISH